MRFQPTPNDHVRKGSAGGTGMEALQSSRLRTSGPGLGCTGDGLMGAFTFGSFALVEAAALAPEPCEPPM